MLCFSIFLSFNHETFLAKFSKAIFNTASMRGQNWLNPGQWKIILASKCSRHKGICYFHFGNAVRNGAIYITYWGSLKDQYKVNSTVQWGKMVVTVMGFVHEHTFRPDHVPQHHSLRGQKRLSRQMYFIFQKPHFTVQTYVSSCNSMI